MDITREEIESLNPIRPYCIETDREQKWYEVGLVDGFDTADSEPLIKKGEIIQQMIDKACKWLKENCTYIHPRTFKETCVVNLNAFKKAMEE